MATNFHNSNSLERLQCTLDDTYKDITTRRQKFKKMLDDILDYYKEGAITKEDLQTMCAVCQSSLEEVEGFIVTADKLKREINDLRVEEGLL